MVKELSSGNFAKEISKGTAVVDFFADWCGPCKMMAPVFEELSGEIKGMSFFKVNTEHNTDIASEYGVMSIPCFVIFKNGEEVNRIIGGMPKNAFKEKLGEYL